MVLSWDSQHSTAGAFSWHDTKSYVEDADLTSWTSSIAVRKSISDIRSILFKPSANHFRQHRPPIVEAEDEEHQDPNQEDSMDGVEAKEKGEDDLIVWRPERSLHNSNSRMSIEEMVEEGAGTMRLDRLGKPMGTE